jgi:hypothetical protein
MKFCYADPPYLGCGRRYAKHHPEAMKWDDPATHRELIELLCKRYPDGWALSLHPPSLQVLLAMCPTDVRVAAWCRPFVVFTNASPQYAWEPVIFRGGRKLKRSEQIGSPVLDWGMAKPPGHNGARRKPSSAVQYPRPDLHGIKPPEFCRFIFRLLNAVQGDQLDDLFPGSGAVTAAWQAWSQDRTMLPALPLFTDGSQLR